MAHTTSELAALILRDAEQLRRNAQGLSACAGQNRLMISSTVCSY